MKLFSVEFYELENNRISFEYMLNRIDQRWSKLVFGEK